MNDTNSGPVQTGNESTQASALGGLQIELRDWFAGMALQGWLASFDSQENHPAKLGSAWDIASDSYDMADAMLAARTTTEPS